MEENNIIDDHPTRPSLPTYAGHPLHFCLVSFQSSASPFLVFSWRLSEIRYLNSDVVDRLDRYKFRSCRLSVATALDPKHFLPVAFRSSKEQLLFFFYYYYSFRAAAVAFISIGRRWVCGRHAIA